MANKDYRYPPLLQLAQNPEEYSNLILIQGRCCLINNHDLCI